MRLKRKRERTIMDSEQIEEYVEEFLEELEKQKLAYIPAENNLTERQKGYNEGLERAILVAYTIVEKKQELNCKKVRRYIFSREELLNALEVLKQLRSCYDNIATNKDKDERLKNDSIKVAKAANVGVRAVRAILYDL